MLRKCLYRGRVYGFHGIFQDTEPAGAILKGIRELTYLPRPVAIIERQDGQLRRVDPEAVQMIVPWLEAVREEEKELNHQMNGEKIHEMLEQAKAGPKAQEDGEGSASSLEG